MALQQGVFNVTDPEWNVVPKGMPQTNRDNLQTLVSKLLSADGPTFGNGGTIQFPSTGTYQFQGPPIVIGPDDGSPPSTQPNAIIFMGTGQGSLAMPILEKIDGGDLFQINNLAKADSNVGGVTFQDLMITYLNVESSGAAVHVLNSGDNVRLYRVVLINCPVGFWIEEGLENSFLDCTVVVNASGLSAVGVQVGNPTIDNAGIEVYIAGSVMRCSVASGIGLLINNAEHVRATNVRIEGFEQGIVIQPGGTDHNVRRVSLTNVSAFSHSTVALGPVGAALLIQPTDGSWVGQVTCEDCEFEPPDSGTFYVGAGVVIDPATGAGGGGIIDQVRLVSCHVCKWNGPGLLIIGGNNGQTTTPTNIEIAGGYYSLNGAEPGANLPSAGIALMGGTNGPMNVRITGAACNNSVFDVVSGSGGQFLTPTQHYGIWLSAGVTNLYVRACDLNGNLTQAISPPSSGTVTNAQVTDSAGYNDQATVVTSALPGSGSVFRASDYSYYGRAAFYLWGGESVAVTIDGVSTQLASGGFALDPGEFAAISYLATSPPHFVMVGK